MELLDAECSGRGVLRVASVIELPGSSYHLPGHAREQLGDRMAATSGEDPSAAELFSVGRFSEALNEYDGHNLSSKNCNKEENQAGQESPAVPDLTEVYAVCNRAAAKLELEMHRSCLRDCDEAIEMDPFFLRAYILKGRAFQSLGKPERARESYEAGVSAGKKAGDVVLFVELKAALRGVIALLDGSSIKSRASSATTRALNLADEHVGQPGETMLSVETDDKSSPSSPDGDSPNDGTNDSRGSAEDLLDSGSVNLDGALGEGGEGSGDEGEGDDNGSAGSVGAVGEGEGTPGGAKKKKKKKSRSKRNKAGKTAWAGEEDEFGQRLTLRAEQGGKVAVEGLAGVLAASNISPVLLNAARAQLCHAVGDPDVDNLIALGYLQVNTGNYRKAVELFRGLLSIKPGLVGAHLGLGSALALLGAMEMAVASFSAAIKANPMEPDCWKRRGQTRAAMGHAVGALSDLDKAMELLNGRDPDVIHQRGMVYHKLRYFNRAVVDFGEVVKSIVDSKVDWNMIGLCRGQLGEPEAATEAYRRALAIDPSFKEAFANFGSQLRDWGKGEEALAAFDSALALDTAYVHAYYLRGLCKHGMGDHRGAQADFMRGLFYDAKDDHCRYMAALCMHARGQLDEATCCYDALLSLKPGHQAWYTRECCVYLWSNVRRPWREFSLDTELDPEFKEGWCKRHDPMTLKRYTRHRKPTGPNARVTIAEVRAPPAESASALESSGSSRDAVKGAATANLAHNGAVGDVLRAALPIGPGIQLRCPGFLSNVRQHRMFGLASLELAQVVRRHWDSLKSGGGGEMVPDAGSSAWSSPSSRGGVERRRRVGVHPIGYRDAFDVAVRWRQLSEPNDPVWWIDRLTPEAFTEGFGLQTPMVNGQLKVVRYYPYYEMAVDLMKRLMCEQSELGEEAKVAVSRPDAGLAELHAAVGHDHWVVTPCERASLGPRNAARVMEGTRLTIVASQPDGFEFTIRTPGTPARWRQYHEELSAVWGKLAAAVCENAHPDDHDATPGDEDRDDAVCDIILEMFYYWVNFGPLSRGSAACGYVVLWGLMAAAGWRLTEPLPPNIQMDWEAILRPNPEAFLAKARPWLKRSRRREDILEGVPEVTFAIPTALEAIRALNGP